MASLPTATVPPGGARKMSRLQWVHGRITVVMRGTGASATESRRVRPRPDTIVGQQAMEARCGENQNSIVCPEKPREKRQVLHQLRARARINPKRPEFELKNRLPE